MRKKKKSIIQREEIRLLWAALTNLLGFPLLCFPCCLNARSQNQKKNNCFKCSLVFGQDKQLPSSETFFDTMVLRFTVPLLKQTKCPPKHTIPLKDNPLTRWSQRLPEKWSCSTAAEDKTLDGVSVGLEGCESAFNATNAVRTCWHFQTAAPPTFLSIRSWDDIQRFQRRPEEERSSKAAEEDPSTLEAQEANARAVKDRASSVALFGEEAFFSDHSSPIVALENFSGRAKSLFRSRLPPSSRIVVGHENNGVRASLVRSGKKDDTADGAAEKSIVFYIPQYGTISSINVVTALGIGLFYAFLDKHFPSSRAIVSKTLSEKDRTAFAPLLSYQQHFVEDLPSGPSEAQPRQDPRPVHPAFYKKDEKDIAAAFHEHRQLLLKLSKEGGTTVGGERFGISVLYENEFDQRNFGGLIRSANAFLVDRVCYLGRKKVNVVGAVGSYHYTPPYYLGPGFEADQENVKDDDALGASVREALSAYQEADAHRQRIIRLACWSLQLRNKMVEVCRGPSQFWLLDCGHQPFYAEDFAVQQQELRERKERGASEENIVASPEKSSLESLRWFLTHCSDDQFLVHLCDTEEVIRAAAGSGIVLVVPQEGKLPHISVLMQCERILTVTPPSLKEDTLKTMTGLPSQVASGIALQRLSAVLHPRLCQL
eukprot:gene13265-9108_t